VVLADLVVLVVFGLADFEPVDLVDLDLVDLAADLEPVDLVVVLEPDGLVDLVDLVDLDFDLVVLADFEPVAFGLTALSARDKTPNADTLRTVVLGAHAKPRQFDLEPVWWRADFEPVW